MRVIEKAKWCVVVLVLFSLILSGCSSKNDDQPKQRKNDFGIAPPPKFALEPPPGMTASDKPSVSGLQVKLIGKWESLAGHWKGSVMGFSQGGNLLLELKGPYSKEPEDQYGRFSVSGNTFEVGPKSGPGNRYEPEFSSENEMLLIHLSGSTYRGFGLLEGRWKRITPPQSSGPIADAKKQVQKIEAKIVKLDAIQKAALADRDEFAAKLRSVGVNSPADLKGNIRGQRLAESLVKLATEIEGRERQLAVIDTELLKAKSLVRRMEQEQAGLSEDEMRNLAVQLREVEERTDGAASTPTTPLDVDAAVEKALKGSTAPKKSK